MPIASRFGREVKDISPEERIIIQIIPLEFISAQEMTKVITPFISADGTIISHGGSNTLLVVDKGINILKLVEGFDVSVFKKTGYRFYPLENMDAEEAAKVLKEALSPYTGSRKDDVKLIPLERLNTLLIISSNAEVFDQSDALIHQMDISGEAAEPKIHIYFVKNGAAPELGDLLNSIFGMGGETKKAAGKERVPTNPFARSLKEKKEKEVVKKAVTAGEAVPSGTLREEIKVTTDEIRNALIIEAIPEDYQIVEKILDRLDVLPRQVLIEVTIAEISLGEGTDLGIEWTFNKDELHDTGSLSANIGASGLQYLVGLSENGCPLCMPLRMTAR
jgi:Type II secretory pathway, component PulD